MGLHFGAPTIGSVVYVESNIENSVIPHPLSDSLLKKHIELAKIIDDIQALMYNPMQQQTKRWTATSLTQLNTRLCGWYDSLPSKLRWKKWGSCFEEVDVGIAALHMLYHATRISLNRHFLQTNNQLTSSATMSAASTIASDSANICLVSADLIVSILHRYKTQYTLKNAPLVFVYGTIVAADVSLNTIQYRGDGTPVLENTNLPALDSALNELAYSWELAGNAKIGLQKIQDELHMKVPEATEDNCPSFVFDEQYSDLVLTPERTFDSFCDFQELQKLTGNALAGINYTTFGNFGNGLDISHQSLLLGNEDMSWLKFSDSNAFNLDGGHGFDTQ